MSHVLKLLVAHQLESLSWKRQQTRLLGRDGDAEGDNAGEEKGASADDATARPPGPNSLSLRQFPGHAQATGWPASLPSNCRRHATQTAAICPSSFQSRETRTTCLMRQVQKKKIRNLQKNTVSELFEDFNLYINIHIYYIYLIPQKKNRLNCFGQKLETFS